MRKVYFIALSTMFASVLHTVSAQEDPMDKPLGQKEGRFVAKEILTTAANNQQPGKVWISELLQEIAAAFESKYKDVTIMDVTMDEQGIYHVNFKSTEGIRDYTYYYEKWRGGQLKRN